MMKLGLKAKPGLEDIAWV